MWLLFLIILSVVLGMHFMIYYLIRAGVQESKKPLPESVRRRRPVQLHTVLHPRFTQQSDLSLWPSL